MGVNKIPLAEKAENIAASIAGHGRYFGTTSKFKLTANLLYCNFVFIP